VMPSRLLDLCTAILGSLCQLIELESKVFRILDCEYHQNGITEAFHDLDWEEIMLST
jgi:hypothetical protein